MKTISRDFFFGEKAPELNLSISSQAMSSFLHDFDLSKAAIVNTLLDNDESHFCAETPIHNRSMMTAHQIKPSKTVMGPIKKASNKLSIQVDKNTKQIILQQTQKGVSTKTNQISQLSLNS